MFLNSIHNIIKTSERLGKICECEQPYNNDVRWACQLGFFFIHIYVRYKILYLLNEDIIDV